MSETVSDRRREYLANKYRLALLIACSQILGLGVEPDTTAVADLKVVRDRVADVEVALVALLRRDGYTWDEVGTELNVRRQTAHYRLGKRVQSWSTNDTDLPSQLPRAKARVSEVLEQVRLQLDQLT